MKHSKYGARKTTIDEITFDSMAEANRYRQLKLLKRAGEVIDFELQPKFEIIPAYIHPITEKKIRATHYIADFRIRWKDGRVTIEDVKGVRTPVFLLKKKLVECQYKIVVEEVS